MVSLGHCVVLVTIVAARASAQSPFSVIPTISDAVRDNAVQEKASSFFRLWDHALKVDGQGPGPAIRVNFEAKTILAPGPLAMLNLIPQDSQNPLYGDTEEQRTQRRNFVKDHLLPERIAPTHENLTKEGGARALTFSGKEVHLRKTDEGGLVVNNAPIRQTMSLEDGTQIYILDDILFDNRLKVRNVFNARDASELAKATGPPLDIEKEAANFVPSPQFGGPPGTSQFNGFAPVFPPLPPGVFPPAPPSPPNVRSGPPAISPPAPPSVRVSSDIRPPAIPPQVSPGIRAPAPPPRFSAGLPPAPPPPPVFSGSFPPAIPPNSLNGVNPPPPPPVFGRVSAPAPPPVGPPSASLSAPPVPVPSNPQTPPASDPGKRIRRQLALPPIDDLSTLEPVIRGDFSDLALPGSSSFVSSTGGIGYLETSGRSESLQLGASPSGNNRPLNELSSIEQFATLFQLASSSDESSIVRVLQRAGLVTMLGLLETSGLLQKLVTGEEGPFILMVPSQEAFSRLSRKKLSDLARGSDLSYHVIPLRGQSLPELTNDSAFVTLLGPKLRFNVYGGITYANGVPVTHGDLTFSHGTIQVVDAILQPPVGDLKSVLVNSGHSLSRITTLLTVVGSFDEGVYTLLAPPDSAISSKGYSWPGLLMQRALGKILLEKHMFKGTWYSEGLIQNRTMITLAGTSVTFRRDADGTLTANGVPMKSCNLSASNGVVHIVADVIPDSDLGTDPTAIPSPLSALTESPVLESFINAGDIIPEVPVVSGLYELPDRDPFQDFISVKEPKTPANIQVNSFTGQNTPFQETNFQNPSIFQTRPDNTQNVFEPSGLFSGIQPQNEKYPSDQDSPALPIPDSLKSATKPLFSGLESFLEMLDETAEYNEDEENSTQSPQPSLCGNEFLSLHEGNVANSIVKPPPLVDQFVPQLISNNPFYETDSPGVLTDIPQAKLEPLPGGMVKEGLVTTPNVIIVIDSSGQSESGTTIRTVESDAEIIYGSLQNRSEFTKGSLVFSPLTPHQTDGSFHADREAIRQQSLPDLPGHVVSGFDEPFSTVPKEIITAEERNQLNIVALLKRLNLSKFAELIEISGLTRTLNFEGPWTVFAPNNEAVEAIPESALRELLEHPRFLRRVVSYHVAPGRFLSGTDFIPGTHLPTLHAGYTLVLSYYAGGPVARWVAGGSVITDLDEMANNGVVHILDRVLYAPYGSMTTTISLSPILTIFSDVLAKDTEVQSYLSGNNPVTVFAPIDDSLQDITIPNDPASRRDWILSHVVEGNWYTAGFSQSRPLLSLSNSTLVTNISDDGGKVMVNNIEITFSDVTSSNGVLHVIESPLITPT